MLHPDFPIIEGHHRMTKGWSVTLPSKFNRRIEDADLVIWRPGLTLWVTVWNNDKGESQEERLRWLRGDISEQAYDVEETRQANLIFLSYRLSESADDKRVPALYCFAVGQDGHAQMATYFDTESDLQTAKDISLSVREERRP